MPESERIQAIRKLLETRELTTGLLKPLGISFESFLRWSQLPTEKAKEIEEKLIAMFEIELKKGERK